MKKLKIILQHNWIFYLIFFFSCIFCVVNINIPKNSKYLLSDNLFKCIIDDIFIDGNYLKMKLIGREKLESSYYFKTLEEKETFINNYELGDKIEIKGELTIPPQNATPNLFNYKKYLYNDGIHYILNISEYKKVSNCSNTLYSLKNLIVNKIEKSKVSYYLYALILGDDRYIDNNILNVYQEIGISHLFAISGMHISILSGLLLLLFKHLHFNEKISYAIVIILLLFYLFITGCSPSILRAVILFILLSVNKLFKFNIKIFNIYLLTVSIIVFLEPFIIFKVGFQFSIIISGSLIIFSDLISKRNNYFSKLLMTSFVAFLIGLPISIYNFYQINILGFIYNLFFVPFMSFILFPLTLITFFISFIEPVLLIAINILECVSKIFVMVPSLLIFKKANIIVVLLYLLFVFLIFKNWNKSKKLLFIFILILLFHYNYNQIFKSAGIIFIDIGQGDCSLFFNNGDSVLVDTGGKLIYNKNNWEKRKHNSNLSNSTIIPLLKSYGIRKLSSLILTHGDYDHMGEAINLVNNFKVEKVIFNCGEFNELEQDLINVLDKKKIPHYSCIKELNIGDNKLYFLNNKDYGNENDNSSVIYTELNNHKFLFMGDAGVEVEEDLIEKYNLHDIDVLKVGHHGSKTSSSKYFINEINPKYSIISVGENNRYGHPNKEVLNILDESKIYRTDQNGSIMFKIKNDKLEIETCSP